jgi:hypothetical protein
MHKNGRLKNQLKLCSFIHTPVTWIILGPNILLNTLLSNTSSLRQPKPE